MPLPRPSSTRRRLAAAAAVPTLVAGIALLPAGPASAAADDNHLMAVAVGENEPAGGALDASAEGNFHFDASAGELCYTVTAKGLDDAAAMHIHEGPAGKNGPIVVPLDQKQINDGEACTTVKADLIEDIVAEPADYYLNIHTPDFPEGAVRGQLSVAPASVDAGSGGQAGSDGVPVAPLAVITLGVAVMGAAGWRLARR